MPAFNHYNLNLLNPAFDSPLVDVVTELEHLRRLQLSGSTPAPVFFQLKEMANIEKAMNFIEDHFQPGDDLSEHFIRELHALAVDELEREGANTPGRYRQKPVQISQSEHLPPDMVKVPEYMAELVHFINQTHPAKYDLMKVALAHHRFAWIHPFGNGNGRVVRLLTYTLLIKYGFNVKAGGGALNPTAVFCNDRDQYYAMLGKADTGTSEGLEAWCVYVLKGMLNALVKVDRLTDSKYMIERILAPALRYARERELVTAMEELVLLKTAKMGVAKASDLVNSMTGLNDRQRTYFISKLVERRMLQPIREGARQYTVGFANSHLMRGVIQALSDESFIPETLNRP